MAEKKVTKRERFAELVKIVEASDAKNKKEMLDFIAHEVELLDKKSGSSKETKTQKENVGIMAEISAALAKVGKPVTITELQNADEKMAAYSNQKLSALLKQMVEADRVVKTPDKKKSLFSLPAVG